MITKVKTVKNFLLKKTEGTPEKTQYFWKKLKVLFSGKLKIL